WFFSGSMAFVCSLPAGLEGEYFDPVNEASSAHNNMARGRVQVGTSVSNSAGLPSYTWLTYNDVLTYEKTRLFTFSDAGSLGSTLTDTRAQLPSGGLMRSLAIAYSNEFKSNRMAVARGYGMREWTNANGLPHSLSAGRHINQVFALQGAVGAGDEVTFLVETRDSTSPATNVNYLKQAARLGRVQQMRDNNGQLIPYQFYTALWTDGGSAHVGPALARNYYASAGQASSTIGGPFASLRTKVLKFPEPNLPVGVPSLMRFGAPRHYGPPSLTSRGRVDELRSSRGQAVTFNNYVRVATDTDAVVNTIYLSIRGRPPSTTGIVKIGHEYIAYRQLIVDRTGVRLTECVRGVLGSNPQAHGANALVVPIQNLPVFLPNSSLSESEGEFAVTSAHQGLNFGFLRAEEGNNAAREDMEVIGFNSRTNVIRSGLFQPSDAGLFRGAYGTQPRSWSRDTAMIWMPVRQPDFMPRRMRAVDAAVIAGTDVAHFEGREAFGPSQLGLLRWSMDAGEWDIPTDDAQDTVPYTVKLVFRVDPEVDWAETPIVLQASGKASRAAAAERLNKRNLKRAGVSDPTKALYAVEWYWGDTLVADDAGVERRDRFVDLSTVLPPGVKSFEWRYYVSFKDGAFLRGDFKRTPRLRGLLLEMQSKTSILWREETR
ncbi:MAG: hypothetical protein KDB07_08380, partial [Planctomycetes bacterium]|nr:hypothetical protein [Planctomycetota bacterium]